MAIQQLKTAHLQIVRLVLLFGIVLAGAAGCHKKETLPCDEKARIESSEERIALENTAGSAATFTVSASGEWQLSVPTGALFSVTPVRGTAGETEITVTAAEDNAESRPAVLGTLVLRLSSGCAEAQVEVRQKPSAAPQTVIMYLPWSGNLYSYFLRNIEDAKKAVAEDILHDSRLLVFLQSSSTDGILSELYYEDGVCREETLKVYEGLDVTQADVISGLFREFTEQAPAEQYGLTIGSHGMAWLPAQGSSKTAMLRSDGTTPEPEKWHWEYVSPDGQFTRWFGDGGSRCTDVPVFAEAIADAGIHFDYILFDDCFMSSIETVYDLRHITDYLIASPCEVMAYGYPYDLILHYLFTGDGADYDLEGICRCFYEFYENYEAPDYNCGAIAVTVCDELEAMAAVMKRINEASGEYVPDPEQPLQQYEYLYNPTRFYDFGDYVHQLCDDTALLAEFDAQLERTVPERYRLHTEYFYSNGKRLIKSYSGISTSAPSTSSYVTNDIEKTAWHMATH